MSNISEWSTTANDNSTSSPDGFPEGMPPSGVNNSSRELMAAIRRQYEDAEWIDYGDTPTYVSTTSFNVAGDLTSRYNENRLLKITDATTLYGYVVSSVYSSPNTLVTVSLNTGVLSVSISDVAAGLISGKYLNKVNAKYFDAMPPTASEMLTVNIGDVIYPKDRGGTWDAVDATTVTENEYNIVTGSATVSFQLRVDYPVNIKEFGAVGNSVTDDTAAIQAAIDSLPVTGGEVRFPNSSGRYLITGTLTLSTGGTSIVGNGIGTNSLYVVDHTFDIFSVEAANCQFRNLSVIAVNKTAAAWGINANSAANSLYLSNVSLNGVHSGIKAAPAKVYGEHIKIININPASGIGIEISGTAEVHEFHHVFMENAVGLDAFAGFNCTDTRVLSVQHTELIKMGTCIYVHPGDGQVTSSLDLIDVWMDTSSGSGLYIAPTGTGAVRRVRINNCWASSCARGIRINGDVGGIQIIGGHFYDNTNEGLYAQTGSSIGALKITDGFYSGNGGIAIRIGAGVNNFSITGNHVGVFDGFPANQNGIVVDAGASDDYIISNNISTGNTTAQITDGGTGVNKFVGNNIT